MNHILRRILFPLPSITKWYLSKKRNYQSRGLKITVLPGVFHPGFFFSTEMMLEYLSQQVFEGKSVLEVGAGTGIVSLYIANQGGSVTATDISTCAVENIKLNSAANGIPLTIIKSDLFERVELRYEWIIVNPPYYPRQPTTEAEYAWYCGEQHEYFTEFFAGLSAHVTPDAKVVMVLSDVCDLKAISGIAARHNFALHIEQQKNVWADGKNYIFCIKPTV